MTWWMVAIWALPLVVVYLLAVELLLRDPTQWRPRRRRRSFHPYSDVKLDFAVQSTAGDLTGDDQGGSEPACGDQASGNSCGMATDAPVVPLPLATAGPRADDTACATGIARTSGVARAPGMPRALGILTPRASRSQTPAARAHRHRPTPPAGDPFETLRLQERLGIVAREVRRLEADQHAWARARRIIAIELAYDALLAEACHLAGITTPNEITGGPGNPGDPSDPDERFRREIELTARGWTW